MGDAIDASASLPASAGGLTVNGAAELAVALPSELFTACVAQRFWTYALADSRDAGDVACHVRDLLNRQVEAADPSFSGLIEQIALTPAFRIRATGDAP